MLVVERGRVVGQRDGGQAAAVIGVGQRVHPDARQGRQVVGVVGVVVAARGRVRERRHLLARVPPAETPPLLLLLLMLMLPRSSSTCMRFLFTGSDGHFPQDSSKWMSTLEEHLMPSPGLQIANHSRHVQPAAIRAAIGSSSVLFLLT